MDAPETILKIKLGGWTTDGLQLGFLLDFLLRFMLGCCEAPARFPAKLSERLLLGFLRTARLPARLPAAGLPAWLPARLSKPSPPPFKILEWVPSLTDHGLKLPSRSLIRILKEARDVTRKIDLA